MQDFSKWEFDPSDTSQKTKYWWFVAYPESMIDNWQEEIGEILQRPYAYCIHDKDCNKETGEMRKTHVHIMIAFNNTTTYKHVLKLVSKLGKISTVKPVHFVRFAYNYLIHDTDDCRKKGKYLYPSNERILGNDFDIGNYEQVSLADKKIFKRKIFTIIEANNFQDFYELTMYMYTNIEDSGMLEVFETNQGFFNNVVKGKYLHEMRIQTGQLRKSK